MATEIKMPQLGLTMTEGTIAAWLKKVGDPVAKGEPIVEITTDKLTNEIESEVDGVLLAIIAEEGEDVPVQGLVAIVGEPGEKVEVSGEKAEAIATEEAPQAAAAVAVKPVEKSEGGRIKVSPLAKKTAEKLGIDLSEITEITGSRIRKEDVIRYSENKPKTEAAPTASAAVESAAPAPAVAPVAGDIVKPLSGMRKVIGKRMVESKVTAPHVTLTTEANVDKMIALRTKLNEKAKDVRMSYTDMLVKMVATALLHVPMMNASISGDNLILHRDVNIGVAVALDEGLVVPVVKNAERKGFAEISKEAKALIGKARENKLSMDELSGATFTISNLGGFGIDAFNPIINLPESGILGVGRIVRKPIVNENDEIVPGSMMALSLSFDHRVVDGALAAQLLSLIKDYVEDPDQMYM